MQQLQKNVSILFALGAVILLFSSVLVMEGVLWGKYAFALGGLLYLFSRYLMRYTGDDLRKRRLNRLYATTSILIVLAGWLQFKQDNSWILLLLVVALAEFYGNMRQHWYEKNPDA
ncbi:MAG: hypothetical protein PHN20_03750 [Bacteroidales bacterium]|nr:hypothetical protein [Bacteroidales bacterium]